MTIRVLMFAALAAKAGVRETSLELAPGATVGDALKLIERLYPATASFAATVATAVDSAYVKPSHRLKEGDELALIPPVSGG